MPRLLDDSSSLLEPIEGIVFDKDGTLADLERRWVPFFRHIIDTTARHLGDPDAESSLAAVLGVGADRLLPGSPAAVKSEGELVEIALGHLNERGWDRNTAMEAMLAGVETATFGPLVPLGDVLATMQALRPRYRLGVATSDSRANTLTELSELGIIDLISAVHCGDDGNGVKPEPQVLWGIAEKWGLAPQAVLFVGDSTQDLDTARAAGCPFIAVDPGPASDRTEAANRADAWMASIDELVPAVPEA